MKILDFFLYLRVLFALLDPDPDPATQINSDQSGSTALENNNCSVDRYYGPVMDLANSNKVPYLV
jgi:hypothetical protein